MQRLSWINILTFVLNSVHLDLYNRSQTVIVNKLKNSDINYSFIAVKKLLKQEGNIWKQSFKSVYKWQLYKIIASDLHCPWY